MIAAAIVCVAVMSQAAQFKWVSGNIKDVDGNKYNGLATLILTDLTVGGTHNYEGTFSNGNISMNIGDSIEADTGFILADHNYSGYFTMTSADGKSVYTSATKTNLAAYPSVNNFGVAAGSWAAVPEPTSGLLLLLGVAGLALKRKRA